MKIDLKKCKLICEYACNMNNRKIFVRELVYRNDRGWLYIYYEGGKDSCYGIKRGPFMNKASHGISRLSKKRYELWRNSHEEFRDEKGWFIDWEQEEQLENLWEKAKNIYTSARIMHSIDDVPF